MGSVSPPCCHTCCFFPSDRALQLSQFMWPNHGKKMTNSGSEICRNDLLPMPVNQWEHVLDAASWKSMCLQQNTALLIDESMVLIQTPGRQFVTHLIEPPDFRLYCTEIDGNMFSRCKTVLLRVCVVVAGRSCTEKQRTISFLHIRV